MSKEISGYINRVILHDDNTATKIFEDRGLVQRSATRRQLAEVEGLVQQPISPRFIQSFGNEVVMSIIDGERDIDNVIPEINEAQRATVLHAAGSSLKEIHSLHSRSVDQRFHEHITNDFQSHLRRLSETFENVAIDSTAISNYLESAYPRDEVSQAGLVHTHGDYWLNNLVGRFNNGTFSVNGVIDWEMGGLNSPFVDFAVVNLSIFRVHEDSKDDFWKGYGCLPSQDAINYFSIAQILRWMAFDEEMDLSGEFYQDKIRVIKEII